MLVFFFFQAEDGIRDGRVTGVQTCALPIFTAVVSGGTTGEEGAFAGTQHLDPRGERLDRRQHRLEGARVPVGVVRDQLELWAAFLRLAPALARADPIGAGGRRAG